MTTKSPARVSPAKLWRRLRGATLVAVGMAVMNIGAYGFTLVAVHSTVPADFGALTALLGLILIGNVASLGLQASGARRIATHDAAHPDNSGHDVLAASLLRAGEYSAAGLTALTLLLTPLIMVLLHIDSVLSVLLMAPTLGMLTVMGAQLGVLQGGKHWRELAIVYAACGVGRLVFGALGLAVSADLLGAMLGIALGSVLPVVLAGWILRGGGRAVSGEVRRVLSETVHGTHVLLAFFAIANADVLLARIRLDEHDSGIYAAGVIVAKACLFLPQFVSIVVFPSLASNPGDTRRLRQAVIAVGGFGLCAIAGAWLLPDLVVSVAGGNEYAEIGPIAWLFAAAGSAYAVLQLVVYAAIAQQERRAALVIWAGLLVLVGVGVLVIGRGSVTGITGVKVLVATAAGCSALLSAVLATGLHRQTTIDAR
jgi:O-antigen/teichoic acid export membrane protein